MWFALCIEALGCVEGEGLGGTVTLGSGLVGPGGEWLDASLGGVDGSDIAVGHYVAGEEAC